MYDLVIAGAGIGAATICKRLKHKYKICVVDVRSHLGGNCYDYSSGPGRVHAYGPHIMHCPLNSKEVLAFILNLAIWTPYTHSVEAEIKLGDKYVRTPFPYSKKTDEILGRSLSADEVIDLYFRGYSSKMWQMKFEDLPESIKGRVPKDTADKPLYFPDQFVGFPVGGYARMLENMFDGVDVVLRAGKDEWLNIPAKQYIYCGRPDQIPDKGRPGFRLGNLPRMVDKFQDAHWLGYQTLNIDFSIKTDWDAKSPVLNICHTDLPITRITHYGVLHDNNCQVISTETPACGASVTDLNPFYPIPTQKNLDKATALRGLIAARYPNVHLLGRLAQFRYMDMYQAIGSGLKLASELDSLLGA